MRPLMRLDLFSNTANDTAIEDPCPCKLQKFEILGLNTANDTANEN